MKSAIGIGSLLLDGLGDTIRVSLTEDPELELDPCRRLANLGTAAAEEAWGVEPFGETTRDTHAFTRRQGALPEQRASDGETDYRNVLHRCAPKHTIVIESQIHPRYCVSLRLHAAACRDGSVFSAVALDELKQPEQLYAKLGCKLAVGMPFKDIASTDTLLMRALPAESDAAARTALRRLQEVGMHVIAPVDVLRETPLQDAIALVPLAQAADTALPEGCKRCAAAASKAEQRNGARSRAAGGCAHRPPDAASYACSLSGDDHALCRMAITIDGTETDEQLRSLGSLAPICALLNVAPGTSRLHASRRIFHVLQDAGLDTPVLHHRVFEGAPHRDEIAILTGSEIGGLLVDGLGDGVLLEVLQEDLDFLRKTSFGLLQVRARCAVMTCWVASSNACTWAL